MNSCKANDERVLKFDKILHYDNKVLVGPWVENRNCYRKCNYRHTSTYKSDYNIKPNVYDGRNVFERCGRGASLDPNILMHTEGMGYGENFTTLYDLSYNYYPKWLANKDPLYKKKPIHNFGNLTKLGMLPYKKCEWFNDVIDPRMTSMTLYKSDYQTPNVDHEPAKGSSLHNVCNPITWNCPCNKEKEVMRCLPPKKEEVKVDIPKMCLVPKENIL